MTDVRLDLGAEPTWLDLYDYRQHVGNMYRERTAALRAGEDAAAVCYRFRRQKDSLFASHPQSSFDVEARRSFTGLCYFPYDASYCVEAIMSPAGQEQEQGAARVVNAIPTEAIPHRRAAQLDFEVSGMALHLTVYWLDVYGGGLFLPFRDATCPDESYGAGRYLFDTVKGSDFMRLGSTADAVDALGYGGGRVMLDFNYAYNPSCAYDAHWVCPLAPRENWLSTAIRAGERNYRETA